MTLVADAVAACRRLQMTRDEIARALLIQPDGEPGAATADLCRSMLSIIAMVEALLGDIDHVGAGWMRLPNRHLRGRDPLAVVLDRELGGPVAVEAVLAAAVECRRGTATSPMLPVASANPALWSSVNRAS